MRPRQPGTRRDACWLFLAALIIYAATSPGPTPYDQYARFAQQLLEGSLSLPERPPHLEMAEFEGRAYFTNPPTPALLLVPFVWLAHRTPLKEWLVAWDGWSIPLGQLQTMLSWLAGALAVAFARVALARVPLSPVAANWGAVLFGFGSIHWYHTTIGSVWYIAQIVHGMFMWLAVMELLGRARPVLMGTFLAAAFWCRMETALAVPFVLAALPQKWTYPMAHEIVPRLRWRWLVLFAAPIAGVILLNFAYNFVRFGTIENYGYVWLIEHPANRGLYPHGLLSIKYWYGHYYTLLRRMPIFLEEFPWVVPSLAGTAIWITTPAFVYALRAPLDRLTGACWLAIALFMSLLVLHCGTGMSQLGYRFAMDFYAPLTVLTLRGMAPPFRWWHGGLIGLSVFINAWSVWVLNILEIQRLW